MSESTFNALTAYTTGTVNLAGMLADNTYRRLTPAQIRANYVVATGSSNAYVAAPGDAWGSYVDGAVISFRANHTNTGAATLNVSGLGAKDIEYANGRFVSSGFIVDDRIYTVQYSSEADAFVMLSGVVPLVGTFSPTYVPNSGSFTTLTYSAQAGSYVAVDIGNGQVDVSIIRLRVSTSNVSVGTASGRLRIGAMPFVSVSGTPGVGYMGQAGNWGTNRPNSLVIDPSSNACDMPIHSTGSGGTTYIAVSDMTTGASASRNLVDCAINYLGVAP